MYYIDTIQDQFLLSKGNKYASYLITWLVNWQKKVIYCKRKYRTIKYFSDQDRPDLWLKKWDQIDFDRVDKVVIALVY